MNTKILLTTIDTHTEGGPTRIITCGIPHLHGKTVVEKMDYFRKHFDHLRKLLMCEPRGHEGMFGAVITESLDPQGDIGVFFLTSSGYLNMCVHSAIGVATACLETGTIIEATKKKEVKLDTPAGLISVEPNYEARQLKSVTIQTNPVFVHTKEVQLDIGLEAPVKAGLVFSAVFFVLLDVKQLGVKICQDEIPKMIELGVKVLHVANKTFNVKHPDNPKINSVEMAMLYEDVGSLHTRSAVISRSGSLDRSPCGAGTGAQMGYLFASNRLKLDEDYINESVFGTRFVGRLMGSVNVGPYKGTIPKIKGAAYITGFHQFLLDKHDPLIEGL